MSDFRREGELAASQPRTKSPAGRQSGRQTVQVRKTPLWNRKNAPNETELRRERQKAARGREEGRRKGGLCDEDGETLTKGEGD